MIDGLKAPQNDMTRTLLGLLFAQSGKSQFDGVVNLRDINPSVWVAIRHNRVGLVNIPDAI